MFCILRTQGYCESVIKLQKRNHWKYQQKNYVSFFKFCDRAIRKSWLNNRKLMTSVLILEKKNRSRSDIILTDKNDIRNGSSRKWVLKPFAGHSCHLECLWLSFMHNSTEIPILAAEKHQWSYGSNDASAINSKINPFKNKLSHLHVSTNGNRLLPIRNRQLTYPKAVIFVLLSKFFEAFAANGVRSMCITITRYISVLATNLITHSCF